MALTAAQILRVRSLAQVTLTDYPDATINGIAEFYTIMDSTGFFPDEDDYTTTYDLYKIAADIVDQEAAKVIKQYDTTADGAQLTRSQMQSQLFALAVRLRQRGAAKASRTIQEAISSEDEEDEGT